MKIFLHIGWYKTGSTAIQKFLDANRDTLLSQYRILYPKTGCVMNAHHSIAWSLQAPSKRPKWADEVGFNMQPEPLFAKIFEEAKDCGAEAIILSSEQLTGTDKFSIEQLADFFVGCEVELIVYLRRQDQYTESFYNQYVKDHLARYSARFDAFSKNDGGLNYYAYLLNWENKFPGLTVNMRIYDRSQFPNKNVIYDFLTAISVPHSASFIFQAGDTNPSLSSTSIRALAEINSKLYASNFKYQSIIKYLRAADNQDNDHSQVFFTYANRLVYLNQFAESNALLFKKYGCSKNYFTLDDSEAKKYIEAELDFDVDLVKQRISNRVNHVWNETTQAALTIVSWDSLDNLSCCLNKLQIPLFLKFNILLVCDSLNNADLKRLISKCRYVSLIQNQFALNYVETINAHVMRDGNAGCQILLNDKMLLNIIEASLLNNQLLNKREPIFNKAILKIRHFLRLIYNYFFDK